MDWLTSPYLKAVSSRPGKTFDSWDIGYTAPESRMVLKEKAQGFEVRQTQGQIHLTTLYFK